MPFHIELAVLPVSRATSTSTAHGIVVLSESRASTLRHGAAATILATRPAGPAVTNAQTTLAQNARNPAVATATVTSHWQCKAIMIALRRSAHLAAFSVMRGRDCKYQHCSRSEVELELEDDSDGLNILFAVSTAPSRVKTYNRCAVCQGHLHHKPERSSHRWEI
jgi:hypothetical protein